MRFLPLLLALLLLPLGAFAAKCSDPGPQCLVAASICCVTPGDEVPACMTQSQCQNANGEVAGVPGEGGMVASASADSPAENTEVTQTADENTTDTAFPTQNNTDNTAGRNTGSSGTLMNPLSVSTIEDLLGLVLDAMVRLGTIALVLMLVYVGYLFVAAQGNPKKIEDARAALMWTVVGGLVLLGASGLSSIVQSTVQAL